MPAGAYAAAIGQTDALHADPAVRSFSRDPANNPLVGASDAELSAAVDVPLNSNKQSAGSLTSLSATKDPGAKTVFKGNYSEAPVRAPAKVPSNSEVKAATSETQAVVKAGVKEEAKAVLAAEVVPEANTVARNGSNLVRRFVGAALEWMVVLTADNEGDAGFGVLMVYGCRVSPFTCAEAAMMSLSLMAAPMRGRLSDKIRAMYPEDPRAAEDMIRMSGLCGTAACRQ